MNKEMPKNPWYIKRRVQKTDANLYMNFLQGQVRRSIEDPENFLRRPWRTAAVSLLTPAMVNYALGQSPRLRNEDPAQLRKQLLDALPGSGSEHIPAEIKDARILCDRRKSFLAIMVGNEALQEERNALLNVLEEYGAGGITEMYADSLHITLGKFTMEPEAYAIDVARLHMPKSLTLNPISPQGWSIPSE